MTEGKATSSLFGVASAEPPVGRASAQKFWAVKGAEECL